MPPLVEKQGLYLRGNYTCRNPALSLPAREALRDKSWLQHRRSSAKVSSTLAAGKGNACFPSAPCSAQIPSSLNDL